MSGLDVLLDTNVLLNYFRWNDCAKQIEADYGFRAEGFAPTISVITKGEMLAFAKNPDWDDEKRKRLDQFLDLCIVIDINTKPVLTAYADLHDANEHSSTKIGQNDLWIAATAQALSVPVLTSDSGFLNLPPALVSVYKVQSKSGITELKR